MLRRIQLFAISAAYLAVLLWAYRYFIVPTYEYEGYHFNWPGTVEAIWLATVSLLPVVFLPMRLRRPSALVAWWLYLTVYIGAIWVPVLSLTLGVPRLLPLQISILFCMGILAWVSEGKLLKPPPMASAPRWFWPILMGFWVACLIFFCGHFSVRGLIVNIAGLFLGGSEYTIRSGFFEDLSHSGRLLSYAGGLVGEALDPFLIAYGLVYRRKWLIVLGVFGQLMFFAVVGAKSILFSTLFLAAVLFLMRRFRNRFGLSLIALLILVVLGAAALDKVDRSTIVTTLATRRTMIDPGLLTGFYYDHYLETPHAGIAYHFPHGNETLPAPSYEIGLIYFGNADIDANANLWAEGFADFGIPGIFGFTLLVALMMWIYDSLASRKNLEFAVLLVALQAFAFSNTAPMTVALTHGGVAVTLLLWFTPAAEPALDEEDDGEFDPLEERWDESRFGDEHGAWAAVEAG